MRSKNGCEANISLALMRVILLLNSLSQTRSNTKASSEWFSLLHQAVLSVACRLEGDLSQYEQEREIG